MNGAAERRDIDGKTDRSNTPREQNEVKAGAERVSGRLLPHFLSSCFPDSKYLRGIFVCFVGEIEDCSGEAAGNQHASRDALPIHGIRALRGSPLLINVEGYPFVIGCFCA